MDSGATGGSNSDLNFSGRSRWTENSKVYTRKFTKRAPKNSNSNDNATTAEDPSAAPSAATTPSENPATTLTTTEVSSAPVATTTAAQISSSSPYDCATVSHQFTGHARPAPRAPIHANVGEDVLQESLDAVVAEDTDTSSQRKGEKSSLQELSPSQVEDDYPTQKQDNGNQTVELQNLENPNLSFSSEAQHIKKLPHVRSDIDRPQTSGGERAQSLGESPLLSREIGLPIGTEVTAVQLPVQDEQPNEVDLMPVPHQVPSVNEPADANGIVKHLVTSRVDDRVRFNLSKATPKNQIEELRKKLELELDQIRRLGKRLEAKVPKPIYKTQISLSNRSDNRNLFSAAGRNSGVYSSPQSKEALINTVDNRQMMKVTSEVNVVGHLEPRPMELARVNSDVGVVGRNLEPRPYHRQLSVAVTENSRGASDFVEKEKRTPKANQYYRNSEFLLGKDRLPPNFNKRLKMSNGGKRSVETERGFGSGFGFDKTRNQVFKSCSSLLQRLMKHKHGWVFNEPVNAKAMGCADYHDIIKNPMDLGTIKTRLSQNHYKSPKEFAEDVRLVFRNAMTYNPQGHDVHVMAEQLLQIFEERWAIIETEYNSHWNYQMYQEAGLPTPTSRKGRAQSHFVPALMQGHGPTPAATAPIVMYAPQIGTLPSDPKDRKYYGRMPAPKKPKAKDLNKRDMTYDEKTRLSTNLQGLPSEKLDVIVQIIKRKKAGLSQNDGEIEVDIDSLDTETLWELDRFVSNYKKSLSKYRRKAELAQARMLANRTVAPVNTNPTAADVQIGSGTASEKNNAPTAVDGEKPVHNESRSSSSSSSSTDSGSSSSDSDSDSSSADGSDAEHAPRT